MQATPDERGRRRETRRVSREPAGAAVDSSTSRRTQTGRARCPSSRCRSAEPGCTTTGGCPGTAARTTESTCKRTTTIDVRPIGSRPVRAPGF